MIIRLTVYVQDYDIGQILEVFTHLLQEIIVLVIHELIY